MKRLSLPDVSEPKSHQLVLEQRGPGLNGKEIIEALRKSFEEYTECAPELQNLPTRAAILEAHLDPLKGLYKSTTAAANVIRDTVDAGIPSRCPYCGNPRRPTTRDHYLPQSTHQQFSLFAPNLIPCCAPCNFAKLAKVWDETTKQRWYFHPYYDSFLDNQFVQLSIIPDAEQGYSIPLLKFEFQWPGATPGQVRTCIEHFERLGINKALLIDHYPAKLRSLHRKTQERIAKGQVVTIANLREELESEEHSDSSEHGLNCWESILNRSIIANENLLAFLVDIPSRTSEPLTEESILPAELGADGSQVT